jgi:hypothetical protein
VASASTSQSGFRRWRRARPFWGGLLLLIAGLELFFSANLTLGDLEVHFGPEGFLSYLLPLLLILSGVLTWVTPGQRLFYGVVGLLTAVYSLIGLNLGGFGLGMFLGIIGGALVLAWAPRRPGPAPTPPPAATDEGPQTDDQPDEHREDHDPATTMIVPGFTGGPDDHRPGSGHDPGYGPGPGHDPGNGPEHRDPPLRPGHQPGPAAATEEFPDAPAYPGEERPPSGGIHRKTFVITLVALALSAGFLIAGGDSPARAEPKCPEGLPSRPAAAAKKEAAKQSSAKPSPSRKVVAKKPKATPKLPVPTTEAPADGEEKTGNPIVDGWNGLVDGVGDLLGATAAPEPSTTTDAPATPAPSTTTTEAPASPSPSASTGSPSPSASSASPSPTPSSSDIPCLGPRVFKEGSADDVPQVSAKGSILETASLTMYNSTYDGVVELDTSAGKVQALKFSMDKAVNEPFSLTIPEADGHTTLIESKKLTTDGTVRFYTPSFKGKLFGVIPVTFTPESPPPLTLPVLWFTDVEINLSFVRCDTLTGQPLKITEKA